MNSSFIQAKCMNFDKHGWCADSQGNCHNFKKFFQGFSHHHDPFTYQKYVSHTCIIHKQYDMKCDVSCWTNFVLTPHNTLTTINVLYCSYPSVYHCTVLTFPRKKKELEMNLKSESKKLSGRHISIQLDQSDILVWYSKLSVSTSRRTKQRFVYEKHFQGWLPWWKRLNILTSMAHTMTKKRKKSFSFWWHIGQFTETITRFWSMN